MQRVAIYARYSSDLQRDRGLIDTIILKPKGDGKEYAVDLHGDLAGILMIASGRNKKFEEGDPVVKQVKAMIEGGNSHFNQDSAQCQGSSENTKSDKMVAGARDHLIRLFKVSDHSTLQKAS